ncbi:MAG: Crp/Fnr family transcriptional regulator [Acidobacteria bacterium]|nr:Crp/Fnr family transcriptional regulator [Acidobacteriota bacterium]
MFPLPATPSELQPSDTNPAARLFEYIERRIGKKCFKIRAKRNSVICCQGMRPSFLYMVQQGEVLLVRANPDGRETILSVMGPGDLFGESALLGRSEITFSAMATKRSVVSLLPERQFRSLLEDPTACRYLLETVSRRCNDAWTQMEVIGCTHVRDKVRAGLLWLSVRYGQKTGRGIRIDLNQTRLALMVGCARETLSREIRRLRKINVIDVRHEKGRKVFYVADSEALFRAV